MSKLSLIGQKFGRLTVISESDYRNRGRSVHWNCKCDCGNTHVSNGSSLKSGATQSCGCLHRERMSGLSASRSEDFTGRAFGKLTVLKKLHADKDRGFLYECQCQCGKVEIVQGRLLKNGDRTSCTSWGCSDNITDTIHSITRSKEKNIYFSGHFDGEGCVSFQRDANGDFPGLSVRVSAVYKPIILEYREYFGGNVHPIKPKPNDTRKNPRWQWQWHIGGLKEILNFINCVLPYSWEKREQLQLAKDYITLRLETPKHNAGDIKQVVPELVEQMSTLKRFEYVDN